MAKVDELSKKQEADRRLALLGIAAEKVSDKKGSCLSSVEMAEFLEGNATFAQQQVYLTHFSSCDTCYREWLELQLELSRAPSATQKPLLLRRKFLTIAGSMLATAASVVFYLNLQQVPAPFDAPPESAPQADMVLEESMVMEKRAQIKSRSALPQKMKRSASGIPQENREQVKDEGSIQMNQERSFLSVASGEPVAAPAMEVEAQLGLEQWLQQVEESCAPHQHIGQAEWERLAQQGKEFLSEMKFPALPTLVAHLQGLADGEQQKSVCVKIVQLLKDTTHE